MIKAFRDDYFFLSNFYVCPVQIGGFTYRNAEAAFQAQKTEVPGIRREFTRLSPSNAKAKGKRVKLRSDWEEVKESAMYEVVKAKFEQNPDLRELLLRTGDESLEEGNTWGDSEWGTVNGKGENKLGKILMQVRDELRVEI